MRRRYLASLLTIMLLHTDRVFAELTPRPGTGDSRIQTVMYDPQEVVGLHVASGFALTVRFAPDERIQMVTVGDSAAWEVQVNRAADNLVVKPQGNPRASNLTVITDARAYNFALYATYAGDATQPYIVSFEYPQPPTEQAKIDPPEEGLYRMKGSKSLYPLEISDDGTSTYVRWPADIALPAIYRDDGSGAMALINGVVDDGVYAVQGVYDRLIFVIGNKRATAIRLKSRKGY